MANLTRAQAQTILTRLGWRVNTSARLTQGIKDFQAGYGFGSTGLTVDGKLGPKTSAAMRYSEARRKAGKTTASGHFSFIEVRCRCGGKYASCRRIFIKRSALAMMEDYRASSGRSLALRSACRCPSHNKAVGGSSTSRHPQGLAADTPPYYSVAKVKSWKCATHIGYGSVSKKVVHIDVGSGGSRTNPIVYVDGR
jgi:zinc D-Ala-D-Ala carboxypeptidase